MGRSPAPARILTLDNIIGQDEVVRRLRTLTELHAGAGREVPHLLFVGGEGRGKHTIAYAFAGENGVSIREVAPERILSPKELAVILSQLRERDVLLFNSPNFRSSAVKEALKGVLQDFGLDIVIGQGSKAQAYRLALPRFTCIGLARALAEFPSELRGAFVTIEFSPYDAGAMRQLISGFLAAQEITAEAGVMDLLVSASKGMPGYAWKLVGWLGVRHGQAVSLADAQRILGAHGVVSDTGSGSSPTAAWDRLSPRDFEGLIGEMLSRQGFRVEMTQFSNDGGIDLIAKLERPFVGGRYLIQCKRYGAGNQVGVQAVREFYGVLQADRKAAKGVLITTSSFTTQALEFARDLPIDLIDGGQLQDLVAALNSEGEPTSASPQG